MGTEKILLVDDEKYILDEMKEFLAMEGYEVAVAENGQKGLQVFENFHPDIVFMDVKMAGMDGIETFRYMKKHRPETKVVIITGLSDEKTLDRVAGVSKDAMDGFIPKPFGFSELRECLAKLKTGDKDFSFQLTKTQLAALDKVAKAGAENASLSFSQLLGEKIELSAQKVAVTPLPEIEFGSIEKQEMMVGIMHKLSGKINGKLTIFFPWQSALNLVHIGLKDLAESRAAKFNEGEQSLLKSGGAVMSGAYLKAINQLLQLKTDISVPELIFENNSLALKNLSKGLEKTSEYLFSIQTEFTIEKANIKGFFLLLPDIDSLKQILKNLGALE